MITFFDFNLKFDDFKEFSAPKENSVKHSNLSNNVENFNLNLNEAKLPSLKCNSFYGNETDSIEFHIYFSTFLIM